MSPGQIGIWKDRLPIKMSKAYGLHGAVLGHRAEHKGLEPQVEPEQGSPAAVWPWALPGSPSRKLKEKNKDRLPKS
jgi:hypothetical protein